MSPSNGMMVIQPKTAGVIGLPFDADGVSNRWDAVYDAFLARCAIGYALIPDKRRAVLLVHIGYLPYRSRQRFPASVLTKGADRNELCKGRSC